jgi:asparagine synthetase B (glutamine-hydrolysing)
MLNLTGEPVDERELRVLRASLGGLILGQRAQSYALAAAGGSELSWCQSGYPSGEDDQWAMCDGRIDQVAELQSTLRLPSHAGERPSHATLLLAAYRKWGTDCPRHLQGDHTLVVWDGREQQLFLSRDPAQSRCLYYALRGERFRWASDPRLLLEDSNTSSDWDLPYLTTYMVMGKLNWERTPFAAIKQVPGGASVTVRGRRLETRSWWELPEAGSLRYRKPAEYDEQFRDLLRESVHARLQSDAPVAITLSRGIDSAAVAATATGLARAGEAPCPAVHAVTGSLAEYPEGDESPDARIIAERLRLPQRVVPIRPYPGDMRPALSHLPEPCGIAGNWNFWQSMQDGCEATGSRVLLTGIGGELLDCDVYYLADLVRERRFGLIPGELWRWRRAGLPLRIPLQLGMVSWVDARVTPWQPEARLQHYPWLRHPELCQTEFASRAIPHPVIRRFRHWLTESARVTSTLQRLLSPAGVELRDPLLDRRLMEFCYAVPLEQKLPLRDAEGKYHEKALVRRAFASELPPGLTRPNAATRGWSGRNLYRDGQTLTEVLRHPPAGLEEVVHLDLLREQAASYRIDRGGKRWVSLTSVLACWLASQTQARMGGTLPGASPLAFPHERR